MENANKPKAIQAAPLPSPRSVSMRGIRGGLLYPALQAFGMTSESPKTTRQGFTQADVNKCLNKNNSHAEESLLSISSALREKASRSDVSPTLKKDGSPIIGFTPDLHRRRMTLWNKGAFTLIELLVVVLIIVVLAAVALPQYQKAVEKTRIARALTVINSIQKSMDVWLLENGWPASGTDLFLWGNTASSGRKVEAAIDTKNGLDCSGDLCTDVNFYYEGICGTAACWVDAYRGLDAYNANSGYRIGIYRPSTTNHWE